MKFLLGTASAVIILAGVRATAALLLPFVLALFLALISFPLVSWLQNRRIHRAVAVAMTMLAILAALVGPSLLVVTAIRQFVTAVPDYEVRLRQIVAESLRWLRARDIDTTYLTGLLDPAQVLGIMVNTLTGVVTLLSIAFLVVLIASFMLFEAADIRERRHRVLPESLKEHLARVAREMQIWLWVKTVISLATGLAAGLWVAILGVDFALLWGLVAFLFNYIPNLGSIVAAFPPALLALIQFGPLAAAFVLLGYVGINAFFGSFMEPYLMGRRIGLSPLVVLLSVIAWGWMWGIAGMLLSVPITMGIKIALENSEDLQWIGRLMEGGNPRVP
jgi:predicted PurR-regulated permease PerM